MEIDAVARADIETVLSQVQADEMGIDPDVGQWIAARDGAQIAGVARITEIGGVRTIDDIWVSPEMRRRGVASALIAHAGAPIWLICDKEMIDFYEGRGFRLADPRDFPDSLAGLYGARGEWPRASNHKHFAMLLA